MEFSYRIDGDLLQIRVNHAYIGIDARISAYERVFADPRVRRGMKLLVTLTKNAGNIPIDQIRIFTEYLVRKVACTFERGAVVVSSDLQYGIMRMGMVHSEHRGFVTGVFRDRQAALDWLEGC